MAYQNPMRNQNPMTNMYGLGDDQRQRMMLANMLQNQQDNNQKYQGSQQSSVAGIPAAVSPYQMMADTINSATQGYGHGQQGGQQDGGQLNQGGTMGQPGDAGIRGNIMQNFNGPGGGSQMGYSPSMYGGGGQSGSQMGYNPSMYGGQGQSGAAGMMGGGGKMMEGIGSGIGSAVGGLGKGLGKGLGAIGKGIGGIGKLFG